MTAVTVPQLSISMEDGEGEPLARRRTAAAVAAGQLVVEVETDKATVEIEAPVAGLLRIVAAEGAIVAVEGVLAELEPAAPGAATRRSAGDGGCTAPDPPIAPAPSSPLRPAWSPEPRGTARSRRPRPASRARARRRARVAAGLGPRRPHRRARHRRRAGCGGRAAPGAGDRLREAVVRNITASWQQIPHVHIGGELAADGLDARASVGSARARR